MTDPSTPQQFDEAVLMPLLVAWEARRRQQGRGIKILLHPYPNCPGCGSAVHEVLTRDQLASFSQHLIAFHPCGHHFTLADNAIDRLYDRAMSIVDQQESRTL